MTGDIKYESMAYYDIVIFYLYIIIAIAPLM